MLQLCSYETVALGYSAFCDLFTQQDYLNYEYYYDLVRIMAVFNHYGFSSPPLLPTTTNFTFRRSFTTIMAPVHRYQLLRASDTFKNSSPGSPESTQKDGHPSTRPTTTHPRTFLSTNLFTQMPRMKSLFLTLSWPLTCQLCSMDLR